MLLWLADQLQIYELPDLAMTKALMDEMPCDFLLFHWCFQAALLDLLCSNRRIGLVVEVWGLYTPHGHQGANRHGKAMVQRAIVVINLLRTDLTSKLRYRFPMVLDQ